MSDLNLNNSKIFSDGSVDSHYCYWLSEEYYKDACAFYKRELETTESDRELRVEKGEENYHIKERQYRIKKYRN